MKKMYLVWSLRWPAHTYEIVGVSLHIHYESISPFKEKRLKELQANGKMVEFLHPQDGFGKPTIVEVAEDLFNKMKDEGDIYLDMHKFKQQIDVGKIEDKVKEKSTNKFQVEIPSD